MLDFGRMVPDHGERAFAQQRNGRGGPPVSLGGRHQPRIAYRTQEVEGRSGFRSESRIIARRDQHDFMAGGGQSLQGQPQRKAAAIAGRPWRFGGNAENSHSADSVIDAAGREA